MRRSLLIILAAVHLLIVNDAAHGQTTSSSVPGINCTAATSGRVTLKKQTGSREKNSGEQQAVVDDGRRPSFQTSVSAAPKPQEIEFFGLTALKESEALKFICETKASDNRQADIDATSAASSLREVLISRGYANAEVNPFVEKGTIRFFVNEGMRVPLAELRFEGNKVFSSPELLAMANACLARVGEGANGYDREKVEYCGRMVVDNIRNAGYLQAKIQNTTQVTRKGHVVSFAVDEGTLYRLGKIKIEGAEVFTEDEIRSRFGLREGDIAKGNSISKWLFEDLKKVYGELGFVEYTADVSPTFKQEQGMVDLKIEIDEGKRFTLRSIHFVGDLIQGVNLEELLTLQPGNVYNHRLFLQSIARLNDTGLFMPVDADRDVEFNKDDEDSLLQIFIKLKVRK